MNDLSITSSVLVVIVLAALTAALGMVFAPEAISAVLFGFLAGGPAMVFGLEAGLSLLTGLDAGRDRATCWRLSLLGVAALLMLGDWPGVASNALISCVSYAFLIESSPKDF